MKIIKTSILSMVFLFGLTATANKTTEGESKKETVENPETPCDLVFTACHAAYPENFQKFDECMRRNGC
ncbi:hypothetical protein [Zhouia amylolytica]|uniref:hypothetical protein n=1 Tax=Zhouia amylolytica TaxID=376730 RepID=UPI0020CBCD14|nr:hypothetical protein [Zhouia amylolytica]MCQ0110351.1 hypothetical protein [Zhouia amylolytica]